MSAAKRREADAERRVEKGSQRRRVDVAVVRRRVTERVERHLPAFRLGVRGRRKERRDDAIGMGTRTDGQALCRRPASIAVAVAERFEERRHHCRLRDSEPAERVGRAPAPVAVVGNECRAQTPEQCRTRLGVDTLQQVGRESLDGLLRKPPRTRRRP